MPRRDRTHVVVAIRHRPQPDRPNGRLRVCGQRVNLSSRPLRTDAKVALIAARLSVASACLGVVLATDSCTMPSVGARRHHTTVATAPLAYDESGRARAVSARGRRRSSGSLGSVQKFRVEAVVLPRALLRRVLGAIRLATCTSIDQTYTARWHKRRSPAMRARPRGVLADRRERSRSARPARTTRTRGRRPVVLRRFATRPRVTPPAVPCRSRADLSRDARSAGAS